MKKRTVSRRTFLARASAAAPMILASGIVSAKGRPGANDKIVTGHIGVGGKGRGNLRTLMDHAGALCDVDTKHIAEAQKLLGRKVKHYADYRNLIEDKDIDAVVISTPDHWHGLMMVHACEAGKDVYVEKPACKTVAEGREMVKAAKRHRRVVQVGSQGRNHPAAKALYHYLQDGMIGKIEKVVCWHNDNPVGGDPLNMGPPPADLDWDLWLGPARYRAYNPDYCHRNFRWMIDLGGGQIRDRGAHVFSLVSWNLGLDRTGPRRITASGNIPTEGVWTCPTNFKVRYEFERPGVVVEWEQPGVKAADFDFGAVYHGTEGKLIVRGGDGRVFPEDKVLEYARKNYPGIDLDDKTSAGVYHAENWLDCIRSRKTPAMDIETGHRVASMCILANLSYLLERPLRWSPRRERFIGDAGADLLLGLPGRGEYHFDA